MRYVYSVIRFVPNPASGEFVNIGAVVGSDEANDWRLRTVGELRRARKLDDTGVLNGALTLVNRMQWDIERYNEAIEEMLPLTAEISEEWLYRLRGECNNIIQLSEPAPIDAADADRALSVVFDHLIIEPEGRAYPAQSKHTVLAAARAAYRGTGLVQGGHVAARPMVRGAHHHERFDFAVANGCVVQLAQAWSFGTAESESVLERVKAWSWSVLDIRDGGGEAQTPNDRVLTVPPNVEVVALYAAPDNDRGRDALAEARSAFDKAKVVAVELAHADELGQRAARLLDHAS